MYSLHPFVQMGLPIGTSTPSFIILVPFGSGLYPESQKVLSNSGGHGAPVQPLLRYGLPYAISHMTKRPAPPELPVLQQLADFPASSAVQTPLPNLQPEHGASGGAILIPLVMIPTKFENGDPCHKSFLLPRFFGLNLYFSPSLSRVNISITFRLWQYLLLLSRYSFSI